MPKFDLTRNQAAAAVAVTQLKAVSYTEVMATWQHPSGAWLCLESPEQQLGIYVLCWRSAPMYGATYEKIEVFIEGDPDLGWGVALKKAEEAFTAGPGSTIVERVEIRKAGNRKGGQKSGEVRKERATEKQVAAVKDPVVEVPALPNPQNSEPVINSKHPDWLYEEQRGFNWFTVALLHVPSTDKTCIILQNQNIRKDGKAPEKPSTNTWEVARWKRFNGESLDGETVGEGLTYPEAVLLVNRIIETNPKNWERGNFK